MYAAPRVRFGVIGKTAQVLFRVVEAVHGEGHCERRRRMGVEARNDGGCNGGFAGPWGAAQCYDHSSGGIALFLKVLVDLERTEDETLIDRLHYDLRTS